ncbi:MAG: 2'-5' RNA ligase family protein [Promethearchaeota archaeon]
MSKVYTSALVIIPPQEKWKPIQDIRKDYDRNINRWMPHITLLYPFRPKKEYFKLENQFSEKCKSFKPFEVILKKFKYFKHSRQNYTLWIDPEPNYLLINLQAELLKLFPDCDDVNNYKDGFRPHLSVGQVQNKIAMINIIKNLQSTWMEMKFTLKELYFISRDKDKSSKFEIAKRFLFA